MPERQLIPSVEKRLAHFMDLTHKAEKEVAEREKKKPTITISREFGCGGYPVAEKLRDLLEEKTHETWAVMDKALLDEVAKNHHLLDRVLSKLGEKSRVIDDIISTVSPKWLSEHDYYRLLCREIFALALGGNVIIVGRGSAIVTQLLENCFHFRFFASNRFKIDYISRKLNMPAAEAAAFIEKKQKQRDDFLLDFLNSDAGDLQYYNLVFNNDKNPSGKIAGIIADYVVPG